jgi:hypothetical protein
MPLRMASTFSVLETPACAEIPLQEPCKGQALRRRQALRRASTGFARGVRFWPLTNYEHMLIIRLISRGGVWNGKAKKLQAGGFHP